MARCAYCDQMIERGNGDGITAPADEIWVAAEDQAPMSPWADYLAKGVCPVSGGTHRPAVMVTVSEYRVGKRECFHDECSMEARYRVGIEPDDRYTCPGHVGQLVIGAFYQTTA